MTADLATAAWGNTYLKDNFDASAVALVTTAGDIVYATASKVLARLGIGTGLQVMQTNSGATAPEWTSAINGVTLGASTPATGKFTTVEPTTSVLDVGGVSGNTWDATSLRVASRLLEVGTGNTKINHRVKNTQNVAQSAVDITDEGSNYIIATVIGRLADTGPHAWIDLILAGWASGTVTVVSSHNLAGSPPTRTYTMDANRFIELETNTETWDVLVDYRTYPDPN